MEKAPLNLQGKTFLEEWTKGHAGTKKNEIVFLGSGGGRIVLMRQLRATGGFRLHLDGVKIHVDPGPGALVRCAEFRESPRADAILVSHAHLDHYLDVPAIIEASTGGMLAKNKRLVLAASEGYFRDGLLDRYHSSALDKIVTVRDGTKLEVGGAVKITAFGLKHSEPSCVGFKFAFSKGTLSYISDTAYFPGLSRHLGDMTILNLLRPDGEAFPGHLCSSEATKLLSDAKPKKPGLVLLSHLGFKVLRAGPESEARKISRESGVRVIAAKEGMRIDIDKELSSLSADS